MSLIEIRKEVDKLKQGEDFTIKTWTDKAIATEYLETVQIETDPEKRQKWLARQKVWTDLGSCGSMCLRCQHWIWCLRRKKPESRKATDALVYQHKRKLRAPCHFRR